MFLDSIFCVLLVTAPSLSRTIKDDSQLCGPSEFSCTDGTCVSLGRLCDGVKDCVDNFDESICLPGANASLALGDGLLRDKRQSGCRETEFYEYAGRPLGKYVPRLYNHFYRKDQWQCRDSSCIPFYGKCDGVVECNDGSDETHALCRNSVCQDNLFRCTYGACVDGTAPCNGAQECADNSDELLPRCLNESRVVKGLFKCDNGQEISGTELCDGIEDCKDGSDENIRACAGKTCDSYLFQCAYGACVDAGADCNNIKDCADNSDESDELCNRTTTIKPTQPPTSVNVGVGNCVLPPYPEHGRYDVDKMPFMQPGHRFSNAVSIKVSCDFSHDVIGKSSSIIPCYPNTNLTYYVPQCRRYCQLTPHRSVIYECLTTDGDSTIRRPCGTKEFVGTTVIPSCRTPNYRGSPSYMFCTDAGWDQIETCKPECGRTTPDGQEYIIDGRRAKHGEIPWHVGIYKKTSTPYKQICGGSLVSNSAVITAAHCFWKDVEGQQSATKYAVAFGKIFRPWVDDHDVQVQYSNVSDIIIPPTFRGAANNFQSDIAVVLLETEIEYQTFIRPVCVDFEIGPNKRQLTAGNLGTIAGWGLTSENGRPSQVLQVVELPYVTYSRCFEDSPRDFQEYLTPDKFCAGFKNGTALCEGDSGGGLAFPEEERGVFRYYLRGIVSTAPRNDNKCDPFARTTFTELIKYDDFIKTLVKL